MRTNLPKIFLTAAALIAVPALSPAQTLFSDNFDAPHASSWTVNTLGAGLSDADFSFNYGLLGIPSAPHSTGGTTTGLRLRANQFGGTTAAFPAGVSVSPNGGNFTGDYQLRFDVWYNFNGPAPGGGSGSTQVTGAGIMTAGTSSQIAGGTIDSITFGTTGDGGASADYRAYAPSAQGSFQDTSGVYAAGNVAGVRNSSTPYYAGLGGASPPAAQTALFPQQTGAAAAGAPAFAWRDFIISKEGNTAKWYLDGTLLATIDLTAAGTTGGNNILLDQYDINSGISTDPNSPNLLFGLFDNVSVTVPEPSAAALLLVGGVMMLARRRRSS